MLLLYHTNIINKSGIRILVFPYLNFIFLQDMNKSFTASGAGLAADGSNSNNRNRFDDNKKIFFKELEREAQG
jgi:hypothetical protein